MSRTRDIARTSPPTEPPPTSRAQAAPGPRTVAHPAAWPVQIRRPGASAGLLILLVLLFLLFGRGAEFLAIALNIPTYLPKVLSVVGLIATLAGNGLRRSFLSKPGVLLTAFTAWLALSAVFSIWQGGSAGTLSGWLKSYVFYILTASLIVTVADCRKAMYAIAAGSLLIASASLFFGSTENRLQIELFKQQGTLGNPNYVAVFLLLGVPSILLLAWSGQRVLSRIAGWAGTLLILVFSVLTGSRMALLVVFFVVLMVFFRVGVAKKAALVLGAGLAAMLTLALAPSSVRDRFATMFTDNSTASTDQDSSDEAKAAAGSTNARKVLLRESIETTWRHPLLGVGVGMFSVSSGERSGWHETHNTYTQISSEAGLPAFLLYLAALWSCIRTTYSHYRNVRDRDPTSAAVAYFIFMSLCVYAVSAIFASLAYDFMFPVFAGIAVAFDHAVRQETPAAQPSTVSPRSA